MKRKNLYWQIPLLVLLVVGTFFIARERRNETENDLKKEKQKDAKAQAQAAGYQHDEGQCC